MRALMDGTVKPEGIDLSYEPLFPAVTFQRALHNKEFDACELGLTFYLATLHTDDPPFVAIPVYPVRLFVHSAIFVNTKSGIQIPKDLIGKKMGELFVYGHDAGTWSKGILADEYGVPTNAYSYYVGGVDRPTPQWGWFPLKPPDNVKVHHIGPEKTLDAMLKSGEIDALYSALVPPSLLKRSPNVRRLFEDSETVERAYFRKTGIFPIMHIVAIRKEVYQRNPWIAQSLYQGAQGGEGQGRGALPLPGSEHASPFHGALAHGASRGEPQAHGRRSLALWAGAQPQCDRHVPALPPRAGACRNGASRPKRYSCRKRSATDLLQSGLERDRAANRPLPARRPGSFHGASHGV